MANWRQTIINASRSRLSYNTCSRILQNIDSIRNVCPVMMSAQHILDGNYKRAYVIYLTKKSDSLPPFPNCIQSQWCSQKVYHIGCLPLTNAFFGFSIVGRSIGPRKCTTNPANWFSSLAHGQTATMDWLDRSSINNVQHIHVSYTRRETNMYILYLYSTVCMIRWPCCTACHGSSPYTWDERVECVIQHRKMHCDAHVYSCLYFGFS